MLVYKMLLLILLIIFTLGIGFVVSGYTGAVWVPTRAKDLSVLANHLSLTSQTRVVEFGSGDGRFLQYAAAQGATAIGYEINPLLWLLARIRCWKYRKVSVKLTNAWNQSFRKADVAFAFLMPEFMGRLEAKFERELKPGTIVIAYIFPFPGKKPYLVVNNCHFYRWQ
ncbi:MAG TPA: hypothetical protein VMR98_01100 [Candidatus Polarisedimenticolaceae bacterium]|nr:hypothetical protein [Candidatus Polarisedimenticolaceae bacterium]